MKKIFILGVFFLSFLITFFVYSPKLFAGQEYAEKKITTEQTVSGLETSVEVKIVECIGQGSTPCEASSSSTTITKKTTLETAP